MKDGHPVFTEEFEGIRAKQRRVLACLSPGWIDRCGDILKEKQLSRDEHGFIELVLREQVQRELEKIDKEVLAKYEAALPHNNLREFFSSEVSKAQRVYDWFSDLADVKRAIPPRINEQEREEVPIIRAVCLLVWSDQLAGDYTDSHAGAPLLSPEGTPSP